MENALKRLAALNKPFKYVGTSPALTSRLQQGADGRTGGGGRGAGGAEADAIVPVFFFFITLKPRVE